MQHLDEIKDRDLFPGITAKLVHGEKCSLSVVNIVKGTRMNIHQHPHEQVTYIIEGELDMEIGGVMMHFKPGMVHVIPSNTPHGAFAVTDVKVIDIFSPVREDYK